MNRSFQECDLFCVDWKRISPVGVFFSNFDMNVVCYGKACTLNPFLKNFFDVFLCKWLYQFIFVSIYKCVTVMIFHSQICEKNGVKNENISNCAFVGVSIRKYVDKCPCVYRIHFKIRNFKIQANLNIFRESPLHMSITCFYSPRAFLHHCNMSIYLCRDPNQRLCNIGSKEVKDSTQSGINRSF